MMVAFHFRGENAEYGPLWVQSIQQAVFECFRELKNEHLHAEIFHGDLLTHNYAKEDAERETILRALLGYNPRRWRTVDHEEFGAALFSNRIYVLAVEGLSSTLQDLLDARLRRRGAYLGAIEIDPANRMHWALYKQSLIPRYRYLNGEIRIYYRKFEELAGGDVKDTGTAADFQKLGFNVSFEDIGARHTFFDRYRSFEHSERLAAPAGISLRTSLEPFG